MNVAVTDKHVFRFKWFTVRQDICQMKVNTDGIMLGAWTDVNGANSALDIGSGTGVIALMLAQKNENLTIDALDIDENAYKQSRDNFILNQQEKRIFAHHVDFLEFQQQKDKKYDVIVSKCPSYHKIRPREFIVRCKKIIEQGRQVFCHFTLSRRDQVY